MARPSGEGRLVWAGLGLDAVLVRTSLRALAATQHGPHEFEYGSVAASPKAA